MSKTYKRETAWIMLLFIGWLAASGHIEELKVLAPFVFFFTGGVYGMDWASKQTTLVRR